MLDWPFYCLRRQKKKGEAAVTCLPLSVPKAGAYSARLITKRWISLVPS
jgi:hypothetical protein